MWRGPSGKSCSSSSGRTASVSWLGEKKDGDTETEQGKTSTSARACVSVYVCRSLSLDLLMLMLLCCRCSLGEKPGCQITTGSIQSRDPPSVSCQCDGHLRTSGDLSKYATYREVLLSCSADVLEHTQVSSFTAAR